MTEQHNGGSYVQWRDLREAMRDYVAELDRRFAEHVRHHETERNADQEALRLARTALEKALAQTNEFRAEATEDKQKYAELSLVISELAKLKQSLETDFARENQALANRIANVASSTAATSTDVGQLQRTSSSREGRELGWKGAALAAGAAIGAAAVSILARIFIG